GWGNIAPTGFCFSRLPVPSGSFKQRPVLFKLFILGLLCVGVSWAATHLCRLVAWRLDVLDHPTGRKIHLQPIPYLGGLGIFSGLLVGVAVGPLLVPDMLFYLPQLRAFVIGALAVVMLGLYDDLHDVSSLFKL